MYKRQALCPADQSEHIAIGTSDPIAHALTLDALTHPGPATPSRLSPDLCAQQYMPGVDPATFADDFAATNAAITANLATAPQVTAEPALKAYVFAGR